MLIGQRRRQRYYGETIPSLCGFRPNPFCHFLCDGRTRWATLGRLCLLSAPGWENPEPVKRVWPKLCLVACASSHTACFYLGRERSSSAGRSTEVNTGKGPCEYLRDPSSRKWGRGWGRCEGGSPGPCSLGRRRARGGQARLTRGAGSPAGGYLVQAAKWGRGPVGFPGRGLGAEARLGLAPLHQELCHLVRVLGAPGMHW